MGKKTKQIKTKDEQLTAIDGITTIKKQSSNTDNANFRNQFYVYLIMYKSRIGNTRTEKRATKRGLMNLLRKLKYEGYTADDVTITVVKKRWTAGTRLTKEQQAEIEKSQVVTDSVINTIE